MPRMTKIGKTATTVSRDEDGTLRVVYHSTAVVSVKNDGTITLNTGGYRTYTTKARMNQAANQLSLGYSVAQLNGEWLVYYKGNTLRFEGETLTLK